MSTTTSSINSSLRPPVEYITGIDIWNSICVSFVFLALLEYALVNYAARADARGGDEPDEFEVFQNEDDISNSVPAPKFSFNCNPGANKIDVISRVMFPVTFFVLIVIYWGYYLRMAERAADYARIG